MIHFLDIKAVCRVSRRPSTRMRSKYLSIACQSLRQIPTRQHFTCNSSNSSTKRFFSIMTTTPGQAGIRGEELAKAAAAAAATTNSSSSMDTLLAHAGVRHESASHYRNKPLSPPLAMASTYTRPAEGPYQPEDAIYTRYVPIPTSTQLASSLLLVTLSLTRTTLFPACLSVCLLTTNQNKHGSTILLVSCWKKPCWSWNVPILIIWKRSLKKMVAVPVERHVPLLLEWWQHRPLFWHMVYHWR